MKKNLVIVESPAKAKTINKFLGKAYLVKASMGHVRDLPKSKLGVDIEDGFKPHYITIRSRSKILKELKRLAAKVESIYLAPDPDREGEAISWHLTHELKSKNNRVCRIMFNEITKRAVEQAILHPLDINENMVNAQQARRILDRIVGYSLSPLLWKKVRKGLSAGRVQSVAVRLVVNREREIEQFQPREYWKIEVDLKTAAEEVFTALVTHRDGLRLEICNQAESQQMLEDLTSAQYQVVRVEKKEQRRLPPPPFITSKLQQEAASKLHFTGKKTMMVAQQLYEGLDIGSEGPVGLITYMRTDSVRVSEEAQGQASAYIIQAYGQEYVPPQPPKYKTKRQVQDAHEAIRPTYFSPEMTPEALKKHLSADQFKLYRLIWQRFLASQMNPALFDATGIDIQAGAYTLRASGSVMRFKGFMSVYTESVENETEGEAEEKKENRLPALEVDQQLELKAVRPEQKFTQPPPRYNDATLVKALEENNIGRPSTYAPIISTILTRNYIERRNGRFYPAEIGVIINDLLVENFPDILNIEFTASMEDRLDEIESGKAKWVEVLRAFYQSFKADLDKAQQQMQDIKSEIEVKLDEICEKCGARLTVKWGKHGKFIACSNYPQCRNTKPMAEDENGKIVIKDEESVEEICEKCGSPLRVKYSRFGKFLACSRYPECRFTKSINKEIGVPCPLDGCGGQVIERRSKRGRMFYGCSHYPKCHFVSWDKPRAERCPQCGHPYLVEKNLKRTGVTTSCPAEGCGYKRSEKSGESGEGDKT
ncbi:type I DNA topoisomerase [candidate division FCPU426 bacterium]|nr:type I DNA topoisomerase [candidate division FCPU426 bacterium]